jgi:hypothetical protein
MRRVPILTTTRYSFTLRDKHLQPYTPRMAKHVHPHTLDPLTTTIQELQMVAQPSHPRLNDSLPLVSSSQLQVQQQHTVHTGFVSTKELAPTEPPLWDTYQLHLQTVTHPANVSTCSHPEITVPTKILCTSVSKGATLNKGDMLTPTRSHRLLPLDLPFDSAPPAPWKRGNRVHLNVHPDRAAKPTAQHTAAQAHTHVYCHLRLTQEQRCLVLF